MGMYLERPVSLGEGLVDQGIMREDMRSHAEFSRFLTDSSHGPEHLSVYGSSPFYLVLFLEKYVEGSLSLASQLKINFRELCNRLDAVVSLF